MPPHHWYQCPWFHGTDVKFDGWMIPPPPTPWWQSASFRHSALFFTGSPAFAQGAGSGLCKAELRPEAKVLDATVAGEASEALRQRVMADPVAKLSVNINDAGRWVRGWITGEVMQLAFADTTVAASLANSAAKLVRQGWSNEAAVVATQNQAERVLVELLCKSARSLGYDALAGHEVEARADGTRTPVPWLAVFTADAITPVEWITSPV